MRKKRTVLITVVVGLATVSVLAAVGFFAGGQSSNQAASHSEAGPSLSQLAPPSDSSKSVAGVPAARANGTSGGPALAPAAPATGAISGGGTAPDASGSLPDLLDRKVILTGNLALNVNDVAGAFDQASRLVRASGGYVEKSSYLASDQAVAQKAATLTLRVPADQYDAVLGQLRGLQGAKVASEGSQSTEVTEQYTDLQSRLRNLQATEQSYLKLLDQAKSVGDILTVNDRLDSVRAQIEQIQGRLNVYDHAIDLATINLTLSPITPGKSASTGGPKPVTQAFADAWAWSLEALRYAASAGAVVLVAAAWLIIPLAIVVLFVRRQRHHPARGAV